VDEKLFRKVRVSEGDPLVEETLALLAKDRLEENRIEVLWRAHFVDRQVRAAVEQLFTGDGDLLLVNYVGQRTKNLTPEEIRASLGRCQVALDFPVPTEEVIARETRARQPAPRSAPKSTPERLDVSVADLIEAGLLHPPVKLERQYKGKALTAQIERDGRVTCLGQTFDSLSTAGGVARASVIGTPADRKYPQTNGWTFWRMKDGNGQIVEVDAARREFLRRRGIASPRRSEEA
jgi:hypothetical protein